MAQYLTYDYLLEKIGEYINRNDAKVVDSFPFFIMLGERRVSRDLKILGSLKYVEGNTIEGLARIPKPDVRWLKTESFFLGINKSIYDEGFNTKVPLFNRDSTFCSFYWPNETLTGTPVYYADYEYNYILLSPTPSTTFKYWISYYEVPNLIDDTTSTNFFTNYNPDLLVAAVLVEAFLFIKNTDTAAIWEQKYRQALASAKAQDDALLQDGTQERGK